MRRPFSTLAATLAAGAVAAGIPSVLAAGGGIVHSATGSGHFHAGSGELRTFSVAARVYADGTVKGQAQLNNRAAGAFAHFEIDCLVVDGPTAIMSGIFTGSNVPALVGERGLFLVRDNGEGANAPPDVITGILDPPVVAPDPLPDCDDPEAADVLEGFLRTVEHGNVQVR